MFGIKRIDRVTNAEVYRRIKAQTLVCTILKQQLTSLDIPSRWAPVNLHTDMHCTIHLTEDGLDRI